MTRGVPTLLIAAAVVVVPPDASHANGCLLDDICPPEREIAVVARDQDGTVTLAVEAAHCRYGDGDREVDELDIDKLIAETRSIRSACQAMEPEERYAWAECLVLEEHALRRMGDIEGRSELFEPGFSREHSIERITGTSEELAGHFEPFYEVIFLGKLVWDSYVTISYVMVGEDRHLPYALYLKDDGDRYWLTEEITLNSPIMPVLGAFNDDEADLVERLPEMNRVLRVAIDPESPQERRTHRVDAVRPDDRASPHELRLFLDDEPHDFDGPVVEHQELSSSAQTLVDAFRAHQREDVTREEILEMWHPEARANVGADLDHLARAELPLRSILTVDSRLDELRLTSSLGVEDGIVWYGSLPASRWSDARSVTIIQREADGELLLANWLGNRRAQQLLTHPDVKRFIAASEDREEGE